MAEVFYLKQRNIVHQPLPPLRQQFGSLLHQGSSDSDDCGCFEHISGKEGQHPGGKGLVPAESEPPLKPWNADCVEKEGSGDDCEYIPVWKSRTGKRAGIMRDQPAEKDRRDVCYQVASGGAREYRRSAAAGEDGEYRWFL